MSRPILSFSERAARDDKRDALESMTITERLLAHILVELMETRSRRGSAEIAKRLTTVGLSLKQVAALLDTTPASLAVGRRRKMALSADAIDPVPENIG